jgi:uncharacterized protein with PQ loop repeat
MYKGINFSFYIILKIGYYSYKSYGIINSMPNLASVSSGLMKYHSLDISSLKVELQWILLK